MVQVKNPKRLLQRELHDIFQELYKAEILLESHADFMEQFDGQEHIVSRDAENAITQCIRELNRLGLYQH